MHRPSQPSAQHRLRGNTRRPGEVNEHLLVFLSSHLIRLGSYVCPAIRMAAWLQIHTRCQRLKIACQCDVGGGRGSALYYSIDLQRYQFSISRRRRRLLLLVATLWLWASATSDYRPAVSQSVSHRSHLIAIACRREATNRLTTISSSGKVPADHQHYLYDIS